MRTHRLCDAGPNSVGATLALCVKDALESQGLPVDASFMGFLIEAGPHVDEVVLLSAFDVSPQYLPPREAAVRSINGTVRPNKQLSQF